MIKLNKLLNDALYSGVEGNYYGTTYLVLNVYSGSTNYSDRSSRAYPYIVPYFTSSMLSYLFGVSNI